MAQVLSNYPASLPPSPTKMVVHFPKSGPPGYLGNLTPPQEAKLRSIWAISYKFVEICEADETYKDAATLEEKFVPPAMKRGPRGKKSTDDSMYQKHPVLLKELLSLLPTDERNMEKLTKEALDALDYWTPHMFRITLLHTVKQEHPDELVLRFLRQCNWDVIKACKSIGKTIYWRTMEVAVEDDILRLGEGGAAEDEKNGQGHARTLGAEFMKILRSGKGFLHGEDKQGRPITYVRVRLHKAGEFSPESMHRYIIYLLEMARLSLRYPVETGVRNPFLPMSGFQRNS